MLLIFCIFDQKGSYLNDRWEQDKFQSLHFDEVEVYVKHSNCLLERETSQSVLR